MAEGRCRRQNSPTYFNWAKLSSPPPSYQFPERSSNYESSVDLTRPSLSKHEVLFRTPLKFFFFWRGVVFLKLRQQNFAQCVLPTCLVGALDPHCTGYSGPKVKGQRGCMRGKLPSVLYNDLGPKNLSGFHRSNGIQKRT